MGIINHNMISLVCLTVLAAAALADRPMVNLADGNPAVLRALFSNFKRENSRVYSSAAEARQRLKNFRGFVHEMAQANDEEPEMEYGVTFFADLTEEEAQQYYGIGNMTEAPAPEAPAPEDDEEMLEKRSSVSHKSRYGSAKHQGGCGSCWAFATVGVIEGYAHIRTGRQMTFSEQEVLDCSGNGNTCRGGWHNQALGYIKQRNHLASSQYRYTQRRGSCRYRSYSNALPYAIAGVHQARGDSNVLRALGSGPLGIAIDFSNIRIRGYYTGIWNGSCGGRVTHAITLVGYGSNYWDIRNSWGTGWGDRGYFKLSRARQNMCSISSYAYYISTRNSGEELEE